MRQPAASATAKTTPGWARNHSGTGLPGRWESFWAPGSYSAVALQTAEDVLDKMAYVLANPVAASLVRRGAEWPGLWSAPHRIGAGARLVKRPDHFFRKDGPTPPTAWLGLTCPAGFDSVEELRGRPPASRVAG